MHLHLVAQQLVFSETSTHSSLKLLNYLLDASILYIFGGEELVQELGISEFAYEVIYVANFEPMFGFEIALDCINGNFSEFFEQIFVWRQNHALSSLYRFLIQILVHR